jgi:hypothetical protein
MDALIYDAFEVIKVELVSEKPVPDISGTRGSLTEAEARAALYEIVNNDRLTLIEKEDWLDALIFKVGNCHESGLAADIIDDIFNEQHHLRYPEWRGRHDDWQSVQQSAGGC